MYHDAPSIAIFAFPTMMMTWQVSEEQKRSLSSSYSFHKRPLTQGVQWEQTNIHPLSSLHWPVSQATKQVWSPVFIWNFWQFLCHPVGMLSSPEKWCHEPFTFGLSMLQFGQCYFRENVEFLPSLKVLLRFRLFLESDVFCEAFFATKIAPPHANIFLIKPLFYFDEAEATYEKITTEAKSHLVSQITVFNGQIGEWNYIRGLIIRNDSIL